jgi:hypothetical protein
MLKWCHPPCILRMVSGSSRQGSDFRYYNSELGEIVQGYLFPNGNVSSKSLGRQRSISDEEIARRWAALRADPRYADLAKKAEAATAGPTIPMALPDKWLDSDEVLPIAETVEARKGWTTALWIGISAFNVADPPAGTYEQEQTPGNSWAKSLAEEERGATAGSSVPGVSGSRVDVGRTYNTVTLRANA